jgi:hypothetical protein
MPLSEGLARGIAYLRAVQLPDGSFESYASATALPFQPLQACRALFGSTLILNALSGIDEAADIRSKLAAWLSSQHSAHWSFNYWATDATERQTMPYPDDLDDTFCALIALYRHDPALITSAALGKVVTLLLATEQQVGGPYRTWLTAKDAPAIWQDIDIAVNSNVCYFLSLVAEPLPNLTKLIDDAIDANSFNSPYYPSAIPVLYYASRAYHGSQPTRLTEIIKQQEPANALDTALVISGIQQLGQQEAIQPLVTNLRHAQQPDGSWPAAAMWLDPAQRNNAQYQGSAALTTALAIEALARHHTNSRKEKPLRSRRGSQPGSELIVQEAKRSFAHLGKELRRQVNNMIDHIAAGDTSQEIVLMPQLFTAGFRDAAPLPADVLSTLSRANLFGWLAYTIYDDFLDEQGSTPLLPVANTALRASLKEFETTLAAHAEGRQLVLATFDFIDSANSWEVAVCRGTVEGDTLTILQLPRYGKLDKLAERSLGHTLTPIIILLLLGYELDSPEVQGLQTALHHYLIARQLLDDMHDWEEDVRRGHLSPVVTELMRATRIEPGDHQLSELVPRLRHAFWQWTLPTMCTRTERHISTARKAAMQTKLFTADGGLVGLLDRLDATLKDTRTKQVAATEFLQAYKKPLA